MKYLILALVAVGFLQGDARARRSIQYNDLPEPVRATLRQAQIVDTNFESYVREIERRTRQRRELGAFEHLIYFVLQSTRFTTQPVIEPTLSAKLFASSGERVPATVEERLRAFLAAARRDGKDERLAYFARLLPDGTDDTRLEFLFDHYARAMRFLHLKEFGDRKAAVEQLYQERGLSSDTGFEANFPVYEGLRVLQQLAPDTRLHRVLVVGPGLDLAPRIDYVELFPPQSYQPLAIADALLRLSLTNQDAVRIHAVDVNDAVVSYLQQVHDRKITELSVTSSLPETTTRQLSPDYRRYFQDFGDRLGRILPKSHRAVLLDQTIAERVTADQLNIITERYQAPALFDLVVVTNVFPYFSDAELALALGNISTMLRSGGYLLHNEFRKPLEVFAAAHQLEPVHVRTVLIAAGVYDSVWIHRKR